MEFRDYKSKIIFLSDSSWDHIQQSHPEITLREIELALKDPTEVRKSKVRPHDIELYYVKKTGISEKYISVVIKNLKFVSYIVSAMTTSKVKSGELIYYKIRR